MYEALRYQRAPRPLEQYAFGQAAEVLQDFLRDEQNDKFTRAALEKTSGHIAEHLRPQLPDESHDTDPCATDVSGDMKRSKQEGEAHGDAVKNYGGLDGVAAEVGYGPNVREIFAARKKPGRRFLRMRN